MRIQATILALAETLFEEAERMGSDAAATDALTSAALTDMLSRARSRDSPRARGLVLDLTPRVTVRCAHDALRAPSPARLVLRAHSGGRSDRAARRLLERTEERARVSRAGGLPLDAGLLRGGVRRPSVRREWCLSGRHGLHRRDLSAERIRRRPSPAGRPLSRRRRLPGRPLRGRRLLREHVRRGRRAALHNGLRRGRRAVPRGGLPLQRAYRVTRGLRQRGR